VARLSHHDRGWMVLAGMVTTALVLALLAWSAFVHR
jgi:hypothetical protein